MSEELIVFVFVGWTIKTILWSLDFTSASTRLSAVWRVLRQTRHDEGQHSTPAWHESDKHITTVIEAPKYPSTCSAAVATSRNAFTDHFKPKSLFCHLSIKLPYVYLKPEHIVCLILLNTEAYVYSANRTVEQSENSCFNECNGLL